MSIDSMVTQFKEIRGETLGEIYKNYNNYLKNDLPDPTNAEETTSFLNELSKIEKTYIQQSWYVKILNILKDKERIQTILEGDDKTFKVMALKGNDWYVSEYLVKLPVNQVVNDILPCMSSVVRRSLLKKLMVCLRNNKNKSKMNTSLAEEYFDVLNERYGVHIAIYMISVCSNEKVQTIFSKYGNLLTENQKNKIEKRFPEIVEFLIDNALNDENTYSFGFKFDLNMYEKNKPKLSTKKLNDAFFKLFKSNDCSYVRSKKIVKALSSSISVNPDHFKFLNKRAIGKCLSDTELIEYYKNSFPSESDREYLCDGYFNDTLNQKPLKKRYEIISTAYRQRYNREILDNSTMYIDCKVIMGVATYDQRRKMYEMSKYGDTSNEKYSYFLKPNELLELSKHKVHLMKSVTDREDLYCTVLRSCDFNREYEFVGVVLKYLLEKHKNETPIFWSKVLESIKGNFEETKIYFEDGVKVYPHIIPYIHDSFYQICQLLFISDLDYFEYYSTWQPLGPILVECLYYKLENNLDYSEELGLFKKIATFRYDFPPLQRIYSHYKNEKLLRFLIDLYGIIERTDKEQIDKFVNIINQYNEFVRTHKTKLKPIDVYDHFPDVITIISQKLDDGSKHSFSNDCLMELIYIETKSPLKRIVYDAFWENIRENKDKREQQIKQEHAILEWMFKNNQAEFLNHIDDILQFVSTLPMQFLRKLKSYEHLELPQKISQHYKQVLENYKINKKPNQVVSALSWFVLEKDFPEIIKDFLPEDEEIDLKRSDQDYLDKLEIQVQIPSLFKSYRYPEILLDSAFKFMKKDFYKYGLAGLHTLFCNISEKKVKELLNSELLLQNRKISVKKHLIYFTLLLLSNHDRFTLLSKMAETEKNLSLLSYVLLGIFRLFCLNPQIEILQFFIEQAEKIATKPEVFEGLFFKFDIVPESFLETYIQSILRIVKKFESPLKPKFLQTLTAREIKLLSENTLDEIITMCFYNSDNKPAYIVKCHLRRNVCIEYLTSANDLNVDHRTGLIIDLTSKVCRGIDADILTFNEGARFEIARELFTDIYARIVWDKVSENELDMVDFSGNLLQKFCLVNFGNFDTFESKMNLQHLSLFFDFRKSNPKDVEFLIDSVNEFYYDVITSYGSDFLPVYVEFLQAFLFDLCVKEMGDINPNLFKIDCFERLISYENSEDSSMFVPICKLIFCLLPDNIPCETDEFGDRYFRLIDRLGKVNDAGVKSYYFKYLQRRKT